MYKKQKLKWLQSPGCQRGGACKNKKVPGRHGAASIFPLIRFWIGLNIKRRRNRQALFILLEFFSFSSIERVHGIQSPLLGSRFIISNKHQQSVCVQYLLAPMMGQRGNPTTPATTIQQTTTQTAFRDVQAPAMACQSHTQQKYNPARVPCVNRTRQQQNVELATL